jgi:dolichyl-phosphate beta-glucosyltransferase
VPCYVPQASGIVRRSYTDTSMDISLILPAFNEASTIARTVEEAVLYFEARNCRYELIVAADGNDGTREKASALAATNSSIKVIGERARRGKGRGIREGVAIASGKVIGFADADNKVPIQEYEKLAPWLSCGFDVAIGSRALPDSKIERPQPLYRRMGARGFAVFMHSVVGISEIGDTQCGFKFFRGEVARDLFRRQRIDGYMFDVEILAIAHRMGHRIKQIPVLWHDDADSRLELFRGNLRNVIDIFKIRFSLSQLASIRFEGLGERGHADIEAENFLPTEPSLEPETER